MKAFKTVALLLVGLGLLGSGRVMAQSWPNRPFAPSHRARLHAAPSTLPMPLARVPSNPGLRIPSSRFATPGPMPAGVFPVGIRTLPPLSAAPIPLTRPASSFGHRTLPPPSVTPVYSSPGAMATRWLRLEM